MNMRLFFRRFRKIHILIFLTYVALAIFIWKAQEPPGIWRFVVDLCMGLVFVSVFSDNVHSFEAGYNEGHGDGRAEVLDTMLRDVNRTFRQDAEALHRVSIAFEAGAYEIRQFSEAAKKLGINVTTQYVEEEEKKAPVMDIEAITKPHPRRTRGTLL